MPAATVGYVVAGAMDAMLTALLTSRAAAMDIRRSVSRLVIKNQLDGDQKPAWRRSWPWTVTGSPTVLSGRGLWWPRAGVGRDHR